MKILGTLRLMDCHSMGNDQQELQPFQSASSTSHFLAEVNGCCFNRNPIVPCSNSPPKLRTSFGVVKFNIYGALQGVGVEMLNPLIVPVAPLTK